jgi:hypothetical protein
MWHLAVLYDPIVALNTFQRFAADIQHSHDETTSQRLLLSQRTDLARPTATANSTAISLLRASHSDAHHPHD